MNEYKAAFPQAKSEPSLTRRLQMMLVFCRFQSGWCPLRPCDPRRVKAAHVMPHLAKSAVRCGHAGRRWGGGSGMAVFPRQVPSCSFLPLLHGAGCSGGQLCSKGNLSGRREFYKADNKSVKTDDRGCPSGGRKRGTFPGRPARGRGKEDHQL